MPKKRKELSLVTLTVNNSCNLHCPHCYLQVENNCPAYIEEETVNKLCESDFNSLAIVGKEALLNEEYVKRLEKLVLRLTRSGKKVSLVTNGKNLNLLSNILLKNLQFIDISFDGGEKTYNSVRAYNFDELKSKIMKVYKKGYKEFNALHTIHNKNIDEIEDLMTVAKIIPFKKIMFSPYLVTENFGKNTVSSVPLRIIFKKLSESRSFLENDSAIINVDTYHLKQENMNPTQVKNLANEYGIEDKLVLYEEDSLPYGVVRVTYDGKVLSPGQSLNPKNYSKGLDLKNYKNVNEAWKALLKN